MRRAYLEIICLNILMADQLKTKGNYLQTAMKDFVINTPNPMGQEEYRIAESIQTAMLGSDA